MWQFEAKQIERMKAAYLARGPVQVGVPLWPRLYMALVGLCLHVCVCAVCVYVCDEAKREK